MQCISSSVHPQVEVVLIVLKVGGKHVLICDVLACKWGPNGDVPVVVTWHGTGIGGHLFIVVVARHPLI